MFKKINNIVFSILFLLIFFIPFLLTDWSSAGVSVDENRNLAKFPSFMVEGAWNKAFTKEFETWFMDHMGLRKKMITANATLQYRVFNRTLSQSDYMIGRNGDVNYATRAIIDDYAHMNLRTEDAVAQIGQSYQTISDWMTARGISFYYVQCFDKHSIYPEQFIDTVNQIGDISKTDQVISYLEEHTTVNTVSMKPVLLEGKAQYETFSNWGDPAHWTPRGAYIGYCHLMESINEDMEEPLRILEESDYNISWKQKGITVSWVVHQDEMIEQFSLISPMAQKTDTSVMGTWAKDERHSVWKNPEADNDLRLLVMGDSYFNDYIIDDIAQSFSEVWMVWGDYTADLPALVELCDPDLVIYECAERVDRSSAVRKLAESLQQEQ